MVVDIRQQHENKQNKVENGKQDRGPIRNIVCPHLFRRLPGLPQMAEHRVRVCGDDLPVALSDVRGVPARALEVVEGELVLQLVGRVAMRDYRT